MFDVKSFHRSGQPEFHAKLGRSSILNDGRLMLEIGQSEFRGFSVNTNSPEKIQVFRITTR